MKILLALIIAAVVTGCVTSDNGAGRVASIGELKEPLIMTNAPITIAWDFRNSTAGKQETYITYTVSDSYAGKTVRVLLLVDLREPSGRRVTEWFMPVHAVSLGQKGTLNFDDELNSALMALSVVDGARGLGAFRVAFYETSDPIGSESEYGCYLTVAGSCRFLGTKATTAYKDQVSNMLTIERQSTY